MNFINDVIFLGISDIKTLYDFYNFIGPYFNEIANLLTFTILVPYFNINLYSHNSTNQIDIIKRLSIDFIALSSILSNVIYLKKKYNLKIGILRGTLLVFFSFIIPTLYLKSFCIRLGKNNNLLKFLFGIIFIYLLDFCVNISMYIFKNHLNKQRYIKLLN